MDLKNALVLEKNVVMTVVDTGVVIVLTHKHVYLVNVLINAHLIVKGKCVAMMVVAEHAEPVQMPTIHALPTDCAIAIHNAMGKNVVMTMVVVECVPRVRVVKLVKLAIVFYRVAHQIVKGKNVAMTMVVEECVPRVRVDRRVILLVIAYLRPIVLLTVKGKIVAIAMVVVECVQRVRVDKRVIRLVIVYLIIVRPIVMGKNVVMTMAVAESVRRAQVDKRVILLDIAYVYVVVLVKLVDPMMVVVERVAIAVLTVVHVHIYHTDTVDKHVMYRKEKQPPNVVRTIIMAIQIVEMIFVELLVVQPVQKIVIVPPTKNVLMANVYAQLQQAPHV